MLSDIKSWSKWQANSLADPLFGKLKDFEVTNLRGQIENAIRYAYDEGVKDGKSPQKGK